MRNCVIGKPCGNSCIARDRTCCIDPSTVVPADPVCSCGKKCGKGCIASNRECYVDNADCMDIIVPVGVPGPVQTPTPSPLYPRPYTAPPFPAPIPIRAPTPSCAMQPPPIPEIMFNGASDVSTLGGLTYG